MPKLDKTDLENIKLIVKETNIGSITKVRIKKGDYELELSSVNNNMPVNINKTSSISQEISEEKDIKDKVNEENIVKSPMVGVAYLSADPKSPPYIKEGQHVKAGDILILIEAMKTFNEIKAPKSGVIKKIGVLNSQPIEYGDILVIFE